MKKAIKHPSPRQHTLMWTDKNDAEKKHLLAGKIPYDVNPCIAETMDVTFMPPPRRSTANSGSHF
jgi:hypothetical protein|tara:strand:+ start:1282 stop:1476 length:195 start_codon:yes stop_codon:yes gene_type:complete